MANEFEKLKKVWYQKLKESGFKDIESKNGSVGRGAPRVDNITEVQQEAIKEYYSMTRHFLTEHKFESEQDRFIWEQYSEGLSVRDISKLLKQQGIKKQKDAVWYVVKRLEKIMKDQASENNSV